MREASTSVRRMQTGSSRERVVLVWARRWVKRRRRPLIREKTTERERERQTEMWTDREEEGGRSVSFFMSLPSVYDTVAINKRSAEEWLFIRSISQSEHIKKPMKP